MRLFLAIDVPKREKNLLDQQLDDLKKKFPNGVWVQKENFHITLHFFGEQDDTRSIKKLIENALFESRSFHLYSLGLDLFIHNQIVTHVNFRREKELENIVDKVRESLRSSDTKKFVPHLTIARSKISSKQQYFSYKKNIARVPIEVDFGVNTLYLFQTIFEGKRPSYKKVCSFSLIKQRQF